MSMMDNNISLRSSVIREILEQAPQRIIRWGTPVIIAFFAIALLLTRYIPYPAMVTVPLTVDTVHVIHGAGRNIAWGLVEQGLYRELRQGMKVKVRISHAAIKDGILEGVICKLGPTKGVFRVEIQLPSHLKAGEREIIQLVPGTPGMAEIPAGNQSLFDKIFSQIKTRI